MKKFIFTTFLSVLWVAYAQNAMAQQRNAQNQVPLFGIIIGQDTVDLQWGIYTPILEANTPFKIFVKDEANIRMDSSQPVGLTIDLWNETAMIHNVKTTADKFNTMNFASKILENSRANRLMIELTNVKPTAVGRKIVTVKLRSK